MAKIPTYERSIKPQSPQADLSSFKSAPEKEAFGAGQFNAFAKLGPTFANIGQQIEKRQTEQILQVNQQEVLDRMNEYNKALQDLTLSNDVDDKGVPKGYLNRQLKNAEGTSVDFDKKAEVLRQKYFSRLSTEDQKFAFDDKSTKLKQSFRDNVIGHEAKQIRDSKYNSLKAYNQTQIDNAPLMKTGADLKMALAENAKTHASVLANLGFDKDSIGQAVRMQNGEMAKAAINSAVDRDWRKAQALLNYSKEMIPAPMVAELEKTINGKAFDDRVQTFVNQASGLILKNGDKNLAASRKLLDSNKEFNTEEKRKIWDSAKGILAEQEKNRKRFREANEFSFLSNAIAAHDKQVPLTEARKMLVQSQYGFDNVQKQKMFEALDKLYTAKESKTDPVVFTKLMDKFRDGNLTSDEVRSNLGSLNYKDQIKILDKVQGKERSAENADEKFAWDKINGELAKITSPRERAEKRYLLEKSFQEAKDKGEAGGGADLLNRYEQLKKIQELPVERSWLGALGAKTANLFTQVPIQPYDPNMTSNPQQGFTLEKRNREQTNLIISDYKKRIGNELYKSLGNNPEKVTQFIQSVDPDTGISLFEKGQPGYNAIYSLKKMNMRVTPSAVRALIEQTGDGLLLDTDDIEVIK